MASKFWVGGTGTWDNATTTHWAITTGGAGGTAVPTTGDTVTFDGSSGGGTVTVAANVSGLSLATLTTTAFTGTLDFSANNPNMTFTNVWNDAGTGGTHTVNLGSGTFTFSNGAGNCADISNTNLTLNAGTSTLLFNSTAPTGQRTLYAPSKTLATVTVGAITSGGVIDFRPTVSTIGTFNITAPNTVWPQSNCTISTALNINGTAYNSMVNFWQLETTGTLTYTLSGTATINYAVIGGMTFTGSPTATNSFDAGRNSGITITGPSGGATGGSVIGS